MSNTKSQTSQLRRSSVSVLTLVGVLYGLPASALDQTALPQGGSVSSGAATLNYSGTAPRLDITQSSQRAVIDWNSFNIGDKATTEFHQPNAGSIAVNRVHDGSPSQILGNLKANGNVMVLNQNGVIFGKTATVDVGGLIASTGTLNEQKFKDQGTVELSNLQTGGKIQNDGQITVADKGLAAFVAPEVVNNGVISAKLGRVELAAGGERATVDLYGDKLVELALDEKSTKAIATNTGTLEGGTVAMTASAVEGIVSNVVNAGGIIEAKGINASGGRIVLTGMNADVVATGTLNAKGQGAANGGQIAVKSNKTVYIAKRAKLDASAGTVGKGGTVDVIAAQEAYVHGDIKARGGSQRGNGGAVETSGHDYIVITGMVDAGASNGTAGKWLIDPRDLVIGTLTNNIDGNGNADDQYRPSAISNSKTGPSFLDANLVRLALDNNTAVYITTVGSPNFAGQSGTISIDADLNVIGGNLASLNLNAAGSIIFTIGNVHGISSAAGLNLAFIAGSDIHISRAIDVQGNVSLNAGGNIFVDNAIRSGGFNVTLTGQRVSVGELMMSKINNSIIDAEGGNILIDNSDRFFSSAKDTLRTQGTGTITLNQYNNGSLQNAVDAFANTGTGLNRLNVKAGTYNEQLRLTQSNFRLQGDGRTNTVLQAPLIMTDSFNEGGLATKAVVSAVGQNNITVTGLAIDGRNYSDDARIAGVAFLNTSGTVSSTEIRNFAPLLALRHEGTGFYAVSNDGASRTVNAFSNIISGFEQNGIQITGAGTRTMVNGNTIKGIGALPTQNGIRLSNLVGANVGFNTIGGVANGINAETITGFANSINGNTVTGRTYGIVLRGSDGFSLTSNTANGGAVAGIALDNSAIAGIQGNTVLGAVTGIQLTGNSLGATLSDNTVDGQGTGVAGIDSDAANGNVTVFNNTVSNVTGTGIGIANGAIYVAGNTVTNTTDGLSIRNSATATILNNTVDQASNIGINVENSADARITNNTLGTTFINKGINVENSTGVVIGGNTVDNANLYGIRADTSDNVQISGNSVTGGSQAGVMVSNSDSVFISGNTVTAAATGIALSNGVDFTTIVSNSIDGQNAGTTGIFADTTSTNLRVLNNTLSNVTGTGIDIDAGATLVLGNVLSNMTDGIDVANSAGVTVDSNRLLQTTGTGISVSTSNGAAVTGNTVDLSSGNGIIVADAASGTVSGNNIAVSGNGISISGVADVTVDTNTVSAATYGISIVNAATAAVSNNQLSGITLAGFYTGGATNGTVTLTDNNVTSLNDGAHFAAGTIAFNGINSFSGDNDGIVFNNQLGGNAGLGTLAVAGNSFGTTRLVGQTGFYIRLANGALFQPGAPTILDASQVNFAGFVANNLVLSASNSATIEPRLLDFDDSSTLGQIFTTVAVPTPPAGSGTPVAGVDPNTILPDQALSRSSLSRIGSVTITGLPFAPGAIPASVLAGLDSAAGGDGTGGSGVGLSAAQLNDLDSAAGGESASCWGDVYSHFGRSATTVTFSLDSAPQALFDAQNRCSTNNANGV